MVIDAKSLEINWDQCTALAINGHQQKFMAMNGINENQLKQVKSIEINGDQIDIKGKCNQMKWMDQ